MKTLKGIVPENVSDPKFIMCLSPNVQRKYCPYPLICISQSKTLIKFDAGLTFVRFFLLYLLSFYISFYILLKQSTVIILKKKLISRWDIFKILYQFKVFFWFWALFILIYILGVIHINLSQVLTSGFKKLFLKFA